MDPNNSGGQSAEKQNLPASAGNPLNPAGAEPVNPVGPGMPEPLNTAAQTPTEMPMGSPTPPLGRSAGEGLPARTTGSKKIMIIVIVLLVLGILGVGGYYFYTIPKSTETSKESVDKQPEQDFNVLGTELDSIEVTDPEGELAEIDKEIALLEATPSSR
ncbi:hypothetical protein HYW44_03160 [Candidatus Daviesbacteria bacterium]|nr:hypothetical protein [Candidatus Daviesbacteria bacterium]